MEQQALFQNDPKTVVELVVRVPKDNEEANQVVERIGELCRNITTKTTERDAEIAKVVLPFDSDLDILYGNLHKCVQALVTYGEKNRQELTQDGKKRSVKLRSGVFGWRWTPWSVSVKDELAAIAWASVQGLSRYLRINVELDRETMRKSEERDMAKTIPGVTIAQSENFYVQPDNATVAAVGKFVDNELKVEVRQRKTESASEETESTSV